MLMGQRVQLDVWYGVQIARKGWLEAADVLNTKTGLEMEQLLGL